MSSSETKLARIDAWIVHVAKDMGWSVERILDMDWGAFDLVVTVLHANMQAERRARHRGSH